jgi:hypothetical protein
VIAACMTVIGAAQGAPPLPARVTDPVAYTIYAALLPSAWATASTDTLLLQQETEPVVRCTPSTPVDAGWRAAYDDYRQQNARPQILDPTLLTINVSYRLLSRSAIEADDVRLAAKYPERWQRRPETIQYAAVSAVGFDPTRAKAVVGVHLGDAGQVHLLERREGSWIEVPGGCVWIR